MRESVRVFFVFFIAVQMREFVGLSSGERVYLHVSPVFGLVDERFERGQVSTDGVDQCHVGGRLGAQARQAHFQRLERLMLQFTFNSRTKSQYDRKGDRI